ncbi:BPI fold-containing family C protein isoform X2 [Fukomys damarensis]|uniref:Bactericidal permeability-increasing protein n=2 Tax=Fukomys damarensis TaxID=885580 RepID=A0A091DBH8_FUKDA|nr:BPI fold-containing family C protein isoform X2 [Fukomys damarensis]XP_010635912.1 BPI fold-containing family C protein isoform X2 [Fukomys damarensis]XP_010635914.1 BPI fold-containing family C protein isoform X2 [Fukomys damarensis]XP_010635915.1 BPI fold-containing family C protein isoform X2 [Fukomys damarensis]XP_033619772.1 BPI fold-containing family C protein isoform X2 [Fukomys damarensis]KFO27610.1 Bactericidal/permeability-increasing protein-like 2 [Fukomys damarensis]
MGPVLCGCLLLWTLHVPATQAAHPGIKARVTQRALDYGVQAGMEIMEQMVKQKHIPDLKGSETLEFLKIDYVNYNFSNIKIHTFSFPNTSLAFVPGVGIRALTNHGTANISADWEVRAPLFRDAGGADLFLSGVYFTGVIIPTQDAFSHPALKLQDCYAQVSHAQVSFTGDLSALYNTFAEPMEKPILRNLNAVLCPLISDEAAGLNTNLSSLEVLTKIDNFTLLDYSLISPPEITEHYLDLNLKGAFYPLEDLTDPRFSPEPFDLPEHSDSMLYIGISEYLFRSASLAHFAAGAFSVTLSTKEISNHLIQNSQGIGNVFSRLADLYILFQPLVLRIMATEPPVVRLQPGNFSLEIPASAILLTQPQNSSELEPIVSMDFVASTSVGLAILGQRLICSLSLNRFRLSVPESNRSDIKVLRFENILSSILHFGVLPLANTKLQQGFPLPQPYNISLVNSDIEVLEGFVLISTDLKYEMSSRQQPSFHGLGDLNLIRGQGMGQPAP